MPGKLLPAYNWCLSLQ